MYCKSVRLLQLVCRRQWKACGQLYKSHTNGSLPTQEYARVYLNSMSLVCAAHVE